MITNKLNNIIRDTFLMNNKLVIRQSFANFIHSPENEDDLLKIA